MRSAEPMSGRRLDLLLAVALLALGQGEIVLGGSEGPLVATHVLWAAAAVAVLVRRDHPVAFFAWAMVVMSLASTFDITPATGGAIYSLYAPLALFGLGAYVASARRALLAAAGGLVAIMAVRVGLDLGGALADRVASEWLSELGMFAPAAAGGVILRDRTEQLRGARERVRAAATGASAVDTALTAERTRIARELHAVVTACVRTALDEVATARSTLARTHGSARSALRRARRAGQEAMTEMRRMLVLLRTEAPASEARLPSAADVPASLRELAERVAGGAPDGGARGHGDEGGDGRGRGHGGRAASASIAVRAAHAGAPVAEAPLPAAAMRVLVALAELPGGRLGVERDRAEVRATVRLPARLDAARLEALSERVRLAGGRLRCSRGRGRRLHVVLPVDAERALPPRYRSAWIRTLPLARAQGIPLLLLVIEVSEAILSTGQPAEHYGTASLPVRIAGAIALAAAFLPRRRWPLLTVAAAVGITALRSLALDDVFGFNPPLYLAAFVAGAYARPLWRGALAGALTAAGGSLTVMVFADFDFDFYTPSVYVFFVAMVTAAWITGVGGRRRLAEARELRALAAAEERLRADEVERAVTAERLRVARELHDLVGHGLTSITLQSAVAERLLDSRPDEAARAIGAVEESCAEVLRELQGLLAALDGSREADAPGLERLAELARRAEAHGLAVALELEGDVAAVPAGQAGAAYRIVQEALTNARKHGGAVPVAVHVAREDGRVRIEVRNAVAAGRPRRAAAARAPARALGAGYGLAGMRERVRVYDGRLEAGPDADGGWRVRAELPLPRDAAPPGGAPSAIAPA